VGVLRILDLILFCDGIQHVVYGELSNVLQNYKKNKTGNEIVRIIKFP
jgi:hypothetical protein